MSLTAAQPAKAQIPLKANRISKPNSALIPFPHDIQKDKERTESTQKLDRDLILAANHSNTTLDDNKEPLLIFNGNGLQEMLPKEEES